LDGERAEPIGELTLASVNVEIEGILLVKVFDLQAQTPVAIDLSCNAT
jgi:hypothetical protein